MNTTATEVSLERLFKLRLVVARVGEMDLAKWWNCNGILGRHGALALSRGFTRTHYFAQARVAFAVARSRCREIFDPPGCMTLWSLPAELEDAFETSWHDWLDEHESWAPFFEQLAQVDSPDLVPALERLELADAATLDAVSKLKRSADGRAFALPGTMRSTDETLALLATAFSRGEVGKLAVPYARLESD